MTHSGMHQFCAAVLLLGLILLPAGCTSSHQNQTSDGEEFRYVPALGPPSSDDHPHSYDHDGYSGHHHHPPYSDVEDGTDEGE